MFCRVVQVFSHASGGCVGWRRGFGRSLHRGNTSTTIGQMAVRVCTDIRGPQRMNPDDYFVNTFSSRATARLKCFSFVGNLSTACGWAV